MLFGIRKYVNYSTASVKLNAQPVELAWHESTISRPNAGQRILKVE